MKTIANILIASLLSIAPSFAIVFPSTYTTTLGAIGAPSSFKINSFQFTNFDNVTNQLTMKIDFNYGGGFSGGAFQSFVVPGFANAGGNVSLNVGDILFNSGGLMYAVAMSSHSGLQQGDLYKITGTMNAQTVLGSPSGSYRPTQAVWANANGATLAGTGTIAASSISGKDYKTTITVHTDAAFRSMLNGNFNFSFESATCGNDVVYGSVSGTPEPGTFALLGAGLLGLGYARRKKA